MSAGMGSDVEAGAAGDAALRSTALLHAALARAARSRLDDARRPLAAIDMQLMFSGAPGDSPQVQAQATGGGRSVCFCEAELHDAQGRTVARAMATFRYAEVGASR
ncbi:hypothetical protein [uncultured Pseudacidovorax sp.]|uniref:hypothetical protein n=1 Tax=uncultured Pseudacidovorax sp. TaxID=679313 RepID=UPI0025D9EDBA|nr:hypothetical protein [uncultured Pseudacidovorax sp.]